MSNKVNLIRTKFTDLKSGDESYGYRIYDDYSQDYSMFTDMVTRPPDDDKVFLRLVADGCPESVSQTIDWAIEHGMYIDDQWFEASEVAEMLANEKS